ncbi:MAG: hypothetical protein ACOYKR_01165 [Sphingobacterium thalpophilum]
MKKTIMLLFAFALLAGCEKSKLQDFLIIKGKVTICHNGQSIQIKENTLNSHLAHGDVIGECKPTTLAKQLLAGSVAVQNGADLTNASEPNMLAGAAWTVILNADRSVTFNLTPTMFTGSPFIQALTIDIVNEAVTFEKVLEYAKSLSPAGELVLANGAYSYTMPAGTLTKGEYGIMFMVNGRAPDNGHDLQRFIGINAMNKSNDWRGFDFSWSNRLKITLP